MFVVVYLLFFFMFFLTSELKSDLSPCWSAKNFDKRNLHMKIQEAFNFTETLVKMLCVRNFWLFWGCFFFSCLNCSGDVCAVFLFSVYQHLLRALLLASTSTCTVMILSFRTDRPGQTVQTQIRLLLEEQSDLGLHCLLFHLHRLDTLLCSRAT